MIRYGGNGIIYSLSFIFSILYWVHYDQFYSLLIEKRIYSEEAYNHYVTSSQIFLGWVLAVSIVSLVLLMLAIIKLSFLVEEMNRRQGS